MAPKTEAVGDVDGASVGSFDNATGVGCPVIFASSKHQLVSIVLGKRDHPLRTVRLLASLHSC